MKHPGYNPTRRNRNIGTVKAGQGQNNRLVIPAAWADDRIYYEKLVNPSDVKVKVHSTELHILVEPTLEHYAHACSIEDVVLLLNMIPVEHVKDFKIIVFRQPKHKERILSPVWGRLAYFSEIGKHSGPAIYLEAQNVHHPIKWHKSMSPDLACEFERLQEDGHLISFDKRYHLIASTLDSVRNTQLYRTLPHEIGHYVDYLQSVKMPSGDNLDKWLLLNDRYDTKDRREKESFAHRYADNFRKEMTPKRLLPFNRIIDEKKMRKHGLKPEWFGL